MQRNRLVLFADDDSAMRYMMAASLRRAGFEPEQCANGTELLRRLRAVTDGGARCPDIVVTDMQMPGASGLDVLHWVGRALPSVPVILMTAFGDSRTHRRASALGARMVIKKPFDLQMLQGTLARILGEHHAIASPGA